MSKITDLTSDTLIEGNELVYVVDGDADKKVTLNQVKEFASAGSVSANIVSYVPADNAVVVPKVTPEVINAETAWDGQYLSGNGPLTTVMANGGSVPYAIAGIKFPIPAGGTLDVDFTEMGLADDDVVIFSLLKQDTTVAQFMDAVMSGQIEMANLGAFGTNIFSATPTGFNLGTFYQIPDVEPGVSVRQKPLPILGKITLYFYSYIEYAAIAYGVTVEELLAMEPEFGMSVYANLKVMMSLPEGGVFPDDLEMLLPYTNEITTMHILVGSVDGTMPYELSVGERFSLDASTTTHILPADIKDGTFLKIEEPCVLLGKSLKAGDYFLVHSNLSEGMVVRLPTTIPIGETPAPAGRFLGLSYSYPENPIEGDWFIQPATSPDSVNFNTMLVFNDGIWKVTGYVPQSQGNVDRFAGITYNSSTNRIESTSGTPVAGWLGASYSAPILYSSTERSIYYHRGELALKASEGGSWTDLLRSAVNINYLSTQYDNYPVTMGSVKAGLLGAKDWSNITSKPDYVIRQPTNVFTIFDKYEYYADQSGIAAPFILRGAAIEQPQWGGGLIYGQMVPGSALAFYTSGTGLNGKIASIEVAIDSHPDTNTFVINFKNSTNDVGNLVINKPNPTTIAFGNNTITNSISLTSIAKYKICIEFGNTETGSEAGIKVYLICRDGLKDIKHILFDEVTNISFQYPTPSSFHISASAGNVDNIRIHSVKYQGS
jgi:hypothetical protein